MKARTTIASLALAAVLLSAGAFANNNRSHSVAGVNGINANITVIEKNQTLSAADIVAADKGV
ncbi:hypothetical protein [Aestuariivirga sp.]|uniref:hypothetical protein n=1 Tax=Aestuariivirga sp. TaxID=2650926 RepID=UPI0039E3AE8E